MAEVPRTLFRGLGRAQNTGWLRSTWTLLALATAHLMALQQDSSSLASWAARVSMARRSFSLSSSTQRNVAGALYWPVPFLLTNAAMCSVRIVGVCVCVFRTGGSALMQGCGKSYSVGVRLAKVAVTRISRVPNRKVPPTDLDPRASSAASEPV